MNKFVNLAVNVNFKTVIRRFLSSQFHIEVHVCFNNKYIYVKQVSQNKLATLTLL